MGLGSEHRGYKMKNAELFRNGQSKPEVLKEIGKAFKSEKYSTPGLSGSTFTVPG